MLFSGLAFLVDCNTSSTTKQACPEPPPQFASISEEKRMTIRMSVNREGQPLKAVVYGPAEVRQPVKKYVLTNWQLPKVTAGDPDIRMYIIPLDKHFSCIPES